MKRILASFLATLSLTALAQTPQPPEIAARNYVLVDLTTQKTLAERDADTPQDPASLTKLMTAYVVFGALRDKKLTLEQTLPVSRRAWDERKGDPSLMFIDTTMSPKVDELLRGLIIQSGNDAAVALQPAQRRALQQASVVGAVFWDETLAALDARAPAALDGLSQRGLVLPQAQSAFGDALEFAFRHHVLHDVTYGTVLKRERLEQHRRVALWLEARSAGRGGEFGFILEVLFVG